MSQSETSIMFSLSTFYRALRKLEVTLAYIWSLFLSRILTGTIVPLTYHCANLIESSAI